MSVQILQGDCLDVLATLDPESVQCCVTSPPYWGLRDYGVSGQIGLEESPAAYVEKMVAVFREVRRVLKDDGTLWVNLGDSYSSYRDSKVSTQTVSGKRRGEPTERAANRNPDVLKASNLKHKDLVGIPWRVAFALQADGWYLRSDIIWHKPNPMPESVQDRPTKAHEYVFLLAKSERYYYDAEVIKEPVTGNAHARGGGVNPKDERNKRTIWTVPTAPYKDAHFATFPPALIRPCVLAGCAQSETVLDPFAGSGTVGEVAEEEGRNSVLIELNAEYVEMIRRRTAQMGLFA